MPENNEQFAHSPTKNSYYLSRINAYQSAQPLSEAIDCDVCVIGAGFTGISSALFLTEQGYNVVVLEAGNVGSGASGHNSGHMMNSCTRNMDNIVKRFGNTTATMLGSMMFEGAEIIRQRIQQYDIDCGYRPGSIIAALSSKQMKILSRQQKMWRGYGHKELQLLDEIGIRQEIASERFVGGLLDPTGGHINPLNLLLGETDALRQRGGQIYEQSPVTKIVYGDPATIYTAQGKVRANFVILAGTAYLNHKLVPWLSRLSMPCSSQIIATEPLSANMALTLLPNNYCVEDCNYLAEHFRLTEDNRLLFGGNISVGGNAPTNIDKIMLPRLQRTFPQLKKVKIDYRWNGHFLLTLSRMPQFGRLENNIYFMQGDSGNGVTMTHLSGKLITEMLRGDAERFDAFAKLPHMPFYGGRNFQITFSMLSAVYHSLRDKLGI